MHIAAAVPTSSPAPSPASPGVALLREFICAHDRKSATLEAFGGDQQSSTDTPILDVLRGLTAHERDELYDLMDHMQAKLAGRGGIFALETLWSLLLSMELGNAQHCAAA